jgi:hypothetical protein
MKPPRFGRPDGDRSDPCDAQRRIAANDAGLDRVAPLAGFGIAGDRRPALAAIERRAIENAPFRNHRTAATRRRLGQKSSFESEIDSCLDSRQPAVTAAPLFTTS